MGVIAEPGLQIFRQPAVSEKWTSERVLSVRYWTPTMISFRTTRYRGFRFTAGHYARPPVPVAAASVMRCKYRSITMRSSKRATAMCRDD